MDTAIPVQCEGYAGVYLTTWLDDEGSKVRLAMRGATGEVMYLDHAAVVTLIKELSLAARVVD